MMKTTIILATQNKGKMKELQMMLDEIGIKVVSMGDAGYVDDIEETGTTLEENALLKARTVKMSMEASVLADDSGLEVEALNGAPGVRSARFAGEEQLDSANRAKLLLVMKDTPVEKRGAQFRCVLAFIDDNGEHIFEGVCAGRIATEEKGELGFGYDPVFIPSGYNRTFAEMTAEEKNTLSHRSKALSALKKYLQNTGNH